MLTLLTLRCGHAASSCWPAGGGRMNAISKLTVSAAAAQRVIDAGVDEARRMGIAASIAVVDESGILRAFHRMDGAALVTVSSSQDKAFTAVGFGIASHAWYPRI